MLELKLREEFRGKRLKGTTVDFTNQSKTGALEVPADEFLKITFLRLLKSNAAAIPVSGVRSSAKCWTMRPMRLSIGPSNTSGQNLRKHR
jgi:hypothetical protein